GASAPPGCRSHHRLLPCWERARTLSQLWRGARQHPRDVLASSPIRSLPSGPFAPAWAIAGEDEPGDGPLQAVLPAALATRSLGFIVAPHVTVAEEDGSRTHLRPSDGPTRI